ncbi:MAG: hypothetical protein L6R39_003086 [Caloplaca ligustica]|nr:MAG: hypothetical protein L6R39_003086 [Caloplaca ligustica]
MDYAYTPAHELALNQQPLQTQSLEVFTRAATQGVSSDDSGIDAYYRDLQAAWNRFQARNPSLEALRAVHHINQENLFQVENAITTKLETNSVAFQNDSTYPIDPLLLQREVSGGELGRPSSYTAQRDATRNGYVEPYPIDSLLLQCEVYGGESSRPYSSSAQRDATRSGYVKQESNLEFVATDFKGSTMLAQSQPADTDGLAPNLGLLTEEHLKLLSLVPDNILATEYGHPYDPYWTTKHNVSDAQVKAVFEVFRAKAKFEALFRRHGGLCVGDIFRVQTGERSGTTTDRFLLVHSFERGKIYPWLQHVADNNADHSDLVMCKGPLEIREAVKGRYSGHWVAGSGLWESINVIKGGAEMGSLKLYRDKLTLWKMMTTVWAWKNGICVANGYKKLKTGKYPFPEVEFRRERA